MTFFAFGLNYETAPVQVRQAFALDREAKRQLYATLQLSAAAEFVLLSTCNRTEIYLCGTEADVLTIQSVLAWKAGTAWPEEAAFFLQDEAAVRHMLHVACGLKSQVVGDAQILAQVKEAYRLAVDEERVGTVLHRLMHTVFRAAKRVATETALANGSASVSSAAVTMARTHFEGLDGRGFTGRRVLLVGAGQMGCLAFEALLAQQPASVAVTNRSRARAQEVAEATGAAVVDWDARYEALREVDVALIATGAAEPVLEAARLLPRSPERPPLLLIDIAVPRNVDPAVDGLPGYTVLDLDALTALTERVSASRQAEVPAAEAICEELLFEFVSWVFHHQALQPAIQAIRDTFERIRVQEIERHHHRFSEADREDLDRITRSIMQKLLAVPIVRLKSADPESIDFVQGVKLLQTLFSRSACEEDAEREADPSEEEAAASAAPSALAARCPFDAGAAEAGKEVEAAPAPERLSSEADRTARG